MDMFSVGNNPNGTTDWNGSISEVFTYSALLTDTEKQKVDSYLAIKYGLTLSGGTMDYIDSNTGVIRSTGSNSGYTNDITII